MRSILKVKAVGILTGLQKLQSRKGRTYATGSILCKTPSQIEIPFSCFRNSINERLFSENKIGERVKITGNISNWRGSISISIYRLALANSVYDRAEFVAIGTLQDAGEDGRLLTLAIESKSNFKGQMIVRALDIATNNAENFKERLSLAKGSHVLARGILRQVSDGGNSRIICWLNSLDIIRERILRADKQERRKNEQ